MTIPKPYKGRQKKLMYCTFVSMFLFIASSFSWACSSNDQTMTSSANQTTTSEQKGFILDLPSLAGKSETEIETLLGTPTEKSNGTLTHPYPNNKYRGGQIEIEFFDGKANLIRINRPIGASFNKESLEKFGLPIMDPTSSNGDTMTWKNLNGWREVTFYGTGISKSLLYVDAIKN